MEFEDEHDEEQEEEEEEEEIMIPPQAAPPNYDSIGGGGNSAPPPHRPRVNPERRSGMTRYRECLKNHAVIMGGHAVDGCGEFMAAGEEGTLDALRCAACNCHRNFHRKENTQTEGDTNTTPSSGTLYPQFSAYYRTPAPPSGYLHVSAPHQLLNRVAYSSGGTHSGEMDDTSHPISSGGSGSKKRHRTKFTQEQKEKMLSFAEKLGWRIQKHDEAAVHQFCSEVKINRQVLKVWMHNNKHTLGPYYEEPDWSG